MHSPEKCTDPIFVRTISGVSCPETAHEAMVLWRLNTLLLPSNDVYHGNKLYMFPCKHECPQEGHICIHLVETDWPRRRRASEGVRVQVYPLESQTVSLHSECRALIISKYQQCVLGPCLQNFK